MKFRKCWLGIRVHDVKQAIRRRERMYDHRLEELAYQLAHVEEQLAATERERMQLVESLEQNKRLNRVLSVSDEELQAVEQVLRTVQEHKMRDIRNEQQRVHVLDSIRAQTARLEIVVRDTAQERKSLRESGERLGRDLQTLLGSSISAAIVRNELGARVASTETMIAASSDQERTDIGRLRVYSLGTEVVTQPSQELFEQLWTLLERYAPYLHLVKRIHIDEKQILSHAGRIDRTVALQAFQAGVWIEFLSACQFVPNWFQNEDISIERVE